jgi:SAM-dependent methyltransferase
MKKYIPFDEHPARYEDWFDRNEFAFQSELKAVREQLPPGKNGIEIGVGTGRFAAPLGIKIGVDPSKEMGKIAHQRGIKVIKGVAESLDFDDSQFDFVLMVTTVCFVDDIELSFQEAHRILRNGGSLIIGFINRNSVVGRLYLEHKEKSVFYRTAIFYTVDELVSGLKRAGFKKFSFNQTLFHKLPMVKSVEPVKEGYGEGSFVVINAEK